jgi:hypothetical protein
VSFPFISAAFVKRICRHITLLLTGAVVMPAFAQAAPRRPAPASPSQQVEAADIDALLALIQPTWTASVSLQTGVGYKENILLSPQNLQNSAFSRTGIETLLWHVPKGAIDYFGFLNGEYTRYLRAARDSFGHTVSHEAQGFGGLEWRYQKPDVFSFAVDGQGYYLDQVFDVSDVVAKTSIAELKAKGAKVGPTVRWAPKSWLWVEGLGTVDRQKFQDGLNDARIGEYAGRIGWKPSGRIELSLAETERRRAFDRRHPLPADLQDDEIPWLLVIHEREYEGRLKTTWGGKRQWTTATRAGALKYADNGTGFLDYFERHVGQDVDWTSGQWTVHTEGAFSRKHYEQQTVGEGFDFSPLVKDVFSASARVERKLSDHWTMYGEFSWERCRSNDFTNNFIASYVTKEGLLGARWSWEK